MNEFTVSFFGEEYDRFVPGGDPETELFKILSEIVKNNDRVLFLAGRNSAFDILSAKVIEKVRQWVRRDNSEFVVVFRNEDEYCKKYIDMQEDFYDETEICEASRTSYPQISHQVRDRYMTDRSDMVIFCLWEEKGPVYDTYVYARTSGKSVVNITGRYFIVD